ncbi:uncharacterized protein LOC122014790 [Zingiber officinale]|uniref:uncharacterized protein LOC122014790 n=1 Tax=Zingiber officinale TaxID=94328 RepID=UPI001C4BF97E|nr:uncharacterized protein LOC122014790 [Zingiber officinale]
MGSFDANNYLPPRKRLLAELRRENSEFDYLPPVPFLPGDLGILLRDVVNSPDSTPEKIIEVSKSVALAATEIAAAARKTAIEKAAAATKAKADAKDALSFLDSMKRNCRKMCPSKNKVRKKCIPIKLLYKTCHPSGSREIDEEVLCNGNSEGQIVVYSKADNFEEEEEEFSHQTKKQQNESVFRPVTGSRKVRIKRKKLPLSRCNFRDKVELKKSDNLSPSKKESNLDSAESDMSSDDTEVVVPDGGVPSKITSSWKCKKIRASQCSSDSNMLKALC